MPTPPEQLTPPTSLRVDLPPLTDGATTHLPNVGNFTWDASAGTAGMWVNHDIDERPRCVAPTSTLGQRINRQWLRTHPSRRP